MEKVKVVVRYSDGRLIKGFTEDFFPNKERFRLMPANNHSGGAIEVSIKDLKAIFMVRDFIETVCIKSEKYIEGECLLVKK
jgi:hypothetical protein